MECRIGSNTRTVNSSRDGTNIHPPTIRYTRDRILYLYSGVFRAPNLLSNDLFRSVYLISCVIRHCFDSVDSCFSSSVGTPTTISVSNPVPSRVPSGARQDPHYRGRFVVPNTYYDQCIRTVVLFGLPQYDNCATIRFFRPFAVTMFRCATASHRINFVLHPILGRLQEQFMDPLFRWIHPTSHPGVT